MRVARNQGAVSILWALGYALFIWAGALAAGMDEARAILLALVTGSLIAVFVYARGAALENPPEERPGVYHRRMLERVRSAGDERRDYEDSTKTPELIWARAALERGDTANALFLLREAEKVAVAQRKLDELLEVRNLVDALTAESSGRTRDASSRLALKVSGGLQTFRADALAAAGVHKQPGREELGVQFARELRTQAADRPPVTTRELAEARDALDDGRLAAALFSLQEARRVAVAQRKPDELVEVYELAQILASRSEGRTHASSERLVRNAAVELGSFAEG